MGEKKKLPQEMSEAGILYGYDREEPSDPYPLGWGVYYRDHVKVGLWKADRPKKRKKPLEV